MDSLEIFYGEVTDVAARVYARVGDDLSGEHTLRGILRGPLCDLAQTLTTEVPFRATAAASGTDSGSLLVEALIPDPCCWTPELPMRYEVDLQLWRGESLVSKSSRTLGIRPFGARGRDLILDHRRWVMRGICQRGDLTNQQQLDGCREAVAALYVDKLDDELLEMASRTGVMLVVALPSQDEETLAAELRRLTHWPAVAIVALEAEPEADLRRVAPNLLLAQLVSGDTAPNTAEWADIVMIESEDTQQIGESSGGYSLPVMALRRGDPFMGLPDARKACDALQRDLAPFGDFAGYLV